MTAYFHKRLNTDRYLIVIFSAVTTSIGIVVAFFPYLAVVLAAVILVVMLASSGLSIPLIILTIPIRGISLGAIGAGSIKIGDLIIALLIAFYFLRDPAKRLFKSLITNPLDLLVVLFVVINVLSVAWADDQSIALLRCGKLLRNLALYVLLRYAFSRDFSRANSLFVGSVILTAWVVIGDLIYWIWIAGGRVAFLGLRTVGPLVSSSPALAVIRGFRGGASLFFEGPENWLLLCIFVVGGWWMWQRRGILTEMFCALTVMAAITMLLILLERGFILGLTAGIVVVLFSLSSNHRHITLRRIAVPGLASVLLLTFFLDYPHLFMQRFAPQTVQADPAVDIRQEIWGEALAKWTQSPLLGTGVGNAISKEEFPSSGGVPHNVYLQMLSELGIIGFALFITLLVTFLIRISRTIKLFEERGCIRELFFTIGIFGGMISYLVAGLVAQDFYSMEPWIYLAITSAIISRNWKEIVQKRAVGNTVLNPSIR